MTGDSRMTVDVRLFGRYRDLTAGEAVTVELPSGARVGDLVTALHASGLGPLPPRPLVAVNLAPATDDTRLNETDEIALIPPAAGG